MGVNDDFAAGLHKFIGDELGEAVESYDAPRACYVVEVLTHELALAVVTASLGDPDRINQILEAVSQQAFVTAAEVAPSFQEVMRAAEEPEG